MGVTWNATYEAEPASSDLAGAVAPDMRALKLALENALKLLVEDTSGNAVGASADMESLRTLRAAVDDSSIEWNGNQLRVKDDGVAVGHITNGAIGASKCNIDTGYQNAQTRYKTIFWCGTIEDRTAVTIEGTKLTIESGAAGVTDLMHIPVNLPDGCIVKELLASWQSDGSQTIHAQIMRGDLDTGGSGASFGTISTTSGTKTSTATGVLSETIDNENRKYWILLKQAGPLSSDGYVYMLRIKYTVTKPVL